MGEEVLNIDMDVVELTQELVKIDSTNPGKNEKEVAGYIKDFLKCLGQEVEIAEFEKNRASVVCSVGKGDGLMFNGHIDTVPVVNAWKEDPFGGKVKGNKIFGLGTSDMKGGVAAMLSAFSNLSKQKFKRKFLMAFVADEEVGLRGSDYLLEKRKEVFKDVKYGIISEPSDSKLEIAQKGIGELKAVFNGKAAHGSRPWQGENAIYKATVFIEEIKMLIKDLEKRKDDVLGSPTINIGKVSGGTKVNIVPDRCEVEIDRRLIPGETEKQVEEELKNILKKLKIQGEIKWMEGSPRPALKISESSRIVKEILKIKKLELSFSPGYTEAELYYTKAGIECVVFGPGKKSTIHAPDEYVEIDKLREAEDVSERLLRKWCL